MKTHCHSNKPAGLAFNMVEITLALGVIAIGVVTILALFPIGANTSKEAMSETYAAETASQLSAYIENAFRNDWATALTSVLTTPPTGAYAAGTLVANTQGTLYQDAGNHGWYRVIRYVDVGGTSDEFDDGTDILDFEGIVRVWREQVTLPGVATPLPDTVAVKLNIEVGWPFKLNLPASERTTATYVLELFKR